MASGHCFICDKHVLGDEAQGGVIHRDELVYVGHVHALDEPDVYRGYLMVEPVRHVSGLGQLTDPEAARLGVVVNRAARALRDLEGAEHVYSFVFGDNVDHLHIHLAPRYPGTPSDYWGVRLRSWPDAPLVDAEAMTELCGRLRTALEG